MKASAVATAVTLVPPLVNSTSARVIAYQEFENYRRRPGFDQFVAKVEQAIIEEYHLELHGKDKKLLRWRDLPPIVDAIAEITRSDVEFSDVLWDLFGPGHHRLFSYMDPRNTGLPKAFINSGFEGEQFHHFLAGVTGDMGEETARHPHLTGGAVIPSHLLNEELTAFIEESESNRRTKRNSLNWGDIRLHRIARPARNAFLRDGRHTVGDSIRALLRNEPSGVRLKIYG